MLYDIGTIRSRFKFLVFTIITPVSDNLAELFQFDFIACIQLFSYLFFLRTIFSLWSSEWQWLLNIEWTICEHKLNTRWANGERLMNGERERFVNGERTVSDARLNARRTNGKFLENAPSNWKLLYTHSQMRWNWYKYRQMRTLIYVHTLPTENQFVSNLVTKVHYQSLREHITEKHIKLR